MLETRNYDLLIIDIGLFFQYCTP